MYCSIQPDSGTALSGRSTVTLRFGRRSQFWNGWLRGVFVHFRLFSIHSKNYFLNCNESVTIKNKSRAGIQAKHFFMFVQNLALEIFVVFVTSQRSWTDPITATEKERTGLKKNIN